MAGESESDRHSRRSDEGDPNPEPSSSVCYAHLFEEELIPPPPAPAEKPSDPKGNKDSRRQDDSEAPDQTGK